MKPLPLKERFAPSQCFINTSSNIIAFIFSNKLLFLFPKVDGIIFGRGVRFAAGIPDVGAGPGPRAAKARRIRGERPGGPGGP